MYAAPKAVCNYDGNCIRKNPSHFQEYDHPLQYPNGHPTIAKNAQRVATLLTVATAANQTAPALGTMPDPTTTPTLQLSALNPFANFLDSPPPVVKPQRLSAVAPTMVASTAITSALESVTGAKRARSIDPSVEPADLSGGHRSERLGNAAPLQGPQSLLRDICETAPRLADFVPSCAAVIPTSPIKSLADLYHIQLPEAEMRSMLNLAIGLEDPLGVFPGVRLVGPFEMLLQIMLSEQRGGAPLIRSDFPSDEALWSHWRFRQDPLESLTFLVTAELHGLHSPAQRNASSLISSIGATDGIVMQRDPTIKVFELGHSHDGQVQDNSSILQTHRRNALAMPQLDSNGNQLLSLSFYRDEWQITSEPEVSGVKQPRGPTRLFIMMTTTYVTTTSCLSTAACNTVKDWRMHHCPLHGTHPPVCAPIGSSVGKAVSFAVEAAKDPLMFALKALTKAPSTLPSLSVKPSQLEAGKALQALFLPYTDAELKAEKANRKKFSKGKTCNGLGVLVPYDNKTEMGYRDPYLEHSELQKTCDLLSKYGASSIYPNIHDCSSKDIKGLPMKLREEFEEELRWLDIGNDECDFGYSLEVGQNILYKSGGCTCPKCLGVFRNEGHLVANENATPVATAKAMEMSACDECLTNAVRILDTSYLLLNRPISQFVLRCHARLLIAGHGRFELAVIM